MDNDKERRARYVWGDNELEVKEAGKGEKIDLEAHMAELAKKKKEPESKK